MIPAAQPLIADLTATLSAKSWAQNTTVLQRVADLFFNGYATFSEDHISVFDDVISLLIERAQAETLTAHLRGRAESVPGGNVGEAEIRAAVRELAAGFDPTYGGFGPAPKFPPAAQISLLLRHHRRTGDAAALAMATKTLDGMAQGGMYDQIGGGFARAWEVFQYALEAELHRRLTLFPPEAVSVCPAQLGEDAGLIGAARLAWMGLEPQR